MQGYPADATASTAGFGQQSSNNANSDSYTAQADTAAANGLSELKHAQIVADFYGQQSSSSSSAVGAGYPAGLGHLVPGLGDALKRDENAIVRWELQPESFHFAATRSSPCSR